MATFTIRNLDEAATQAELWCGILSLPQGRKRDAIPKVLNIVAETGFTGPLFPFNCSDARHFAQAMVSRRRSGRPVGKTDAQIAEFGVRRGLPVATRNTCDIVGCGVTLTNPWDLLS